MLIQLCVMACMLTLSAFWSLTGPHLWVALGVLAAIVGTADIVDERRMKTSSESLQLTAVTAAEKIALLGILAVFLFLLCRSLYFYDVTWDGLAYGLPRISFWKQFQTLFTKLPTLQLNIVTSEWNGELNALYYSLLARNDQATSFGNAEVWLVAAATYSWLAEGFGLTKKLTWAVGLVWRQLPHCWGWR
jgi:hypothetical protein